MITSINQEYTLCPSCGDEVEKGANIYEDELRGKFFCDECKELYWQEVREAEGDRGKMD